MNRIEFKRKTLIDNIERALTIAQREDLPATIKEVYAFGGILRDKEKVHDFDAVFLLEQTLEQAQMWDRFRRNFNNTSNENREISPQQLDALFQPYYRQDIPLSKVAMIDSVSKTLEEHGIKPKWAACFSWTDFYFSFLGIFYPELDKVLRKLLLKGIRGIQAIFRNYEDFKEGHTMLVAENFQLAWSMEKRDVRKNLEMPQEAKIAFITSELKLFQKQLMSLKEQLSKLKIELSSITSGTELSFNFDKLNSKHVDISFDENETYENLLIKCELARQELRAHREEISVLRNLEGSIENFQERKSDTLYPLPSNYTMRELATSWTISGTPKYEVKEGRIREILSDLGLPEDHIVTIQRYGTTTQYELEPDRDKRNGLLAIAEEEKIKNKYLRPLNRVAKKFDKNFYIDVGFMKEKPTSLTIRYYRQLDDENENMRKTILSKLESVAFDISQNKWSISASKTIKSDGNKTIKELENIVRKVLEEYG